MSNTQSYEGPHLEPLLERVRDEHGSSARILSVDKVRSGGVGGFFQRERFEVRVEHDTDGSEAPTEARVARDPDASRSEPTVGPAPTTPTTAAAPVSILDLAASIDADERAGHPTPSTFQPAFQEILARVTHTLGDAPAPPHGDLGAPRPGPDPSARNAPDAAFADADAASTEHDPACLPLDPAPGSTPRPDRRTSVTSVVATLDTLDTLDTPDTLDAGHRAVVALGLPFALVPPASTATRNLRRALIQRLTLLPKVPALPREPGAVIAVVGPADEALLQGARLAVELSLDGDGVVLASREEHLGIPAWLHVRDAATVRNRRRAWFRRNGPVVVAVDAPVSSDGDRWAPDVLAALEPTMVIGTVDARRKTEDVDEWTRQVGGLDAVMIENLRATVSPGALLQLGFPVMTIDGLVATPARWADVLTRRLALAAA